MKQITLLLVLVPLILAQQPSQPQPFQPQMPPVNAGPINIQNCLTSVQDLKPIFTKILIDSQILPTHKKSVRDFKLLATQLQVVSGQCGIPLDSIQGAGIPENCDNDIMQVNKLAQSLNGADDNYFFTIGKIVSLTQILPTAIRDCSNEESNSEETDV